MMNTLSVVWLWSVNGVEVVVIWQELKDCLLYSLIIDYSWLGNSVLWIGVKSLLIKTQNWPLAYVTFLVSLQSEIWQHSGYIACVIPIFCVKINWRKIDSSRSCTVCKSCVYPCVTQWVQWHRYHVLVLIVLPCIINRTRLVACDDLM